MPTHPQTGEQRRAAAAPPAGSTSALPFTHGPDRHVFRFRYQGPPADLHGYLLERYRFGRDADWARSFYPDRVRLNGEPVAAGATVQGDDEIAYLHLRADEPPPPALAAPLHADPWLVALVKPDTLPVNPAGVFYFGALAILARETLGNPELTPLHRLDLETSGPVLFAAAAAHLPRLHAMFREKSLAKRYRALVHGRFPPELREIAGRIVPDTGSRIHTRLRLEPVPPEEARARLAEGPATRRTRQAAAELSLTRIHGVTHHEGSAGPFSELALEPVTGKTNQLRVHLAHVGHPIVGDKKYHPDEAVFLDWHAHRDFARLAGRLLLPRQALHCESLAFTHPFTGEPLTIHAPAALWQAKVAGLLGPVAGPDGPRISR